MQKFLNVFIFYLLLQSILSFNKIILNLDHQYASIYLVDVFVYAINLLTVLFFMESDIVIIAYSTLIATTLAIMWQWRLIFKLNNISYRMVIYKENILQEIYKNSFKVNIGSVLYSSKDIIIASVFTSYGSGVYSLFSYASKFVGVILQIVNAPIVNVFTAKISHTMAKKAYANVGILIKEVLIKTTSLFLFSSIIMYFILPYVLNVIFDNKFSEEDIVTIQYIFLYLVIYFSIVNIESPFHKVLNLFKLYNFGLFINVIFFLLMGIGYFIFQLFSLNYEYILLFLIMSQLIKMLLSMNKYRLEITKMIN